MPEQRPPAPKCEARGCAEWGSWGFAIPPPTGERRWLCWEHAKKFKARRDAAAGAVADAPVDGGEDQGRLL